MTTTAFPSNQNRILMMAPIKERHLVVVGSRLVDRNDGDPPRPKISVSHNFAAPSQLVFFVFPTCATMTEQSSSVTRSTS